MKKLIIIISLIILEVIAIQVKTPERIAKAGYFVETHTVQTLDGYILTLYRIPYSTRLNNKNERDKPIIMIVPGLFCSSDTWLLCGPDNGIAYMLVDAGYDVWLINPRGNLYSRKHKTLLPSQPEFWEFSFHEIGIYDIPACIDYILNLTEQNGVHYIGHSQGGTVLLVLLSENPSYNAKIKTVYSMSPVEYLNNAQSPFFKILGPFFGKPSELANQLGKTELLPNIWLINKLGSLICQERSHFLPVCSNVLFLIGGWNSSHFNYTLLSDALDTHPAGCSTRQYIHYLQSFVSGHFRKYDYGPSLNQVKYGTTEPPDYNLNNINLSSPINLIYSSNDYLSDEKDVKRLAKALKGNAKLRHVCYSDFNHLDFIWAIDVKKIINDCIVDLVNKYENRPYNKGTLCKCLKEVNLKKT